MIVADPTATAAIHTTPITAKLSRPSIQPAEALIGAGQDQRPTLKASLAGDEKEAMANKRSEDDEVALREEKRRLRKKIRVQEQRKTRRPEAPVRSGIDPKKRLGEARERTDVPPEWPAAAGMLFIPAP